jgi:hypothetical protein
MFLLEDSSAGEGLLANYVHIFTGRFGSEARARAYCEQQWPASDHPIHNLAYIVWEDHASFWPIREELKARYLDGSFIETIWSRGDDRPGVDWDYLETLLSRDDVARCRAKTEPQADTLILIYQEALGGFNLELPAPTMIAYCGRYAHRAYA